MLIFFMVTPFPGERQLQLLSLFTFSISLVVNRKNINIIRIIHVHTCFAEIPPEIQIAHYFKDWRNIFL